MSQYNMPDRSANILPILIYFSYNIKPLDKHSYTVYFIIIMQNYYVTNNDAKFLTFTTTIHHHAHKWKPEVQRSKRTLAENLHRLSVGGCDINLPEQLKAQPVPCCAPYGTKFLSFTLKAVFMKQCIHISSYFYYYLTLF
jgi:hypothetical protein